MGRGSDLIKDNVFELNGTNNSIATKIDQDDDFKNCMMVRRVMGSGTGKHTISIKLAKGPADRMVNFCEGWSALQ